MKSMKTFGLAALAALMAMAFVGVSSAMAGNTQLCTVDENPCGAGHAITHIHEETLSGSLGVLLTSFANIKCDVLFLSSSVGALGAPQDIQGHFTYTNCKRKKIIGEENCTVTEVSGTTALLPVLRTSHEGAAVTYEYEMSILCGSVINCTYNGEGLEGTATGPLLSTETNGETRVENAVTHKLPGGVCPETAELDLLTTPLPNPVYISA